MILKLNEFEIHVKYQGVQLIVLIYLLQMNEMEALRIDEELQKQKYTPSHHHTFNRMSDQAAIGMVDIEMLTPGGDPGINRLSAPECSGLKKTALSNSLIDLTDGKRECDYVL